MRYKTKEALPLAVVPALAPRCFFVVTTLALGEVSTSCNLVLDADRPQCSIDAECAARGAAFAGTACVDSFCQTPVDPKWGCRTKPMSADQESGPFQTSLVIVDAVSQTPLAGVGAELCRKLDVDCSAPLSDTVVSDEHGMVSFTVDRGFDGYVALTAPGISSTLYFFNPPVTGATVTKTVSLSSPGMMLLFAQEIGVQLAADRGTVIISAVDCEGKAAQGVSYSTTAGDGTTVAFYTVGQLPTTKTDSTDQSGFGGLINVPAGVVTVTGTLVADGSRIGTLGLLARRGTMTYTVMVPLVD